MERISWMECGEERQLHSRQRIDNGLKDLGDL